MSQYEQAQVINADMYGINIQMQLYINWLMRWETTAIQRFGLDPCKYDQFQVITDLYVQSSIGFTRMKGGQPGELGANSPRPTCVPRQTVIPISLNIGLEIVWTCPMFKMQYQSWTGYGIWDQWSWQREIRFSAIIRYPLKNLNLWDCRENSTMTLWS